MEVGRGEVYDWLQICNKHEKGKKEVGCMLRTFPAYVNLIYHSSDQTFLVSY